MSNLGPELDKTISSAVNAKIEAEVFKAMTSDDVIGQYVAAALNEKVADPDNRYGSKQTLINVSMKKAIKKMTEQVIADEVNKQVDAIREEVEKALKASIGVISDSLVTGFVANVQGGRPNIEVNFKDPDRL